MLHRHAQLLERSVHITVEPRRDNAAGEDQDDHHGNHHILQQAFVHHGADHDILLAQLVQYVNVFIVPIPHKYRDPAQ